MKRKSAYFTEQNCFELFGKIKKAVDRTCTTKVFQKKRSILSLFEIRSRAWNKKNLKIWYLLAIMMKTKWSSWVYSQNWGAKSPKKPQIQSYIPNFSKIIRSTTEKKSSFLLFWYPSRSPWLFGYVWLFEMWMDKWYFSEKILVSLFLSPLYFCENSEIKSQFSDSGN